MRKSMTYGTLPSREEFDAAFDCHCDGGGRFNFGNDSRVGNCSLKRSELWAELVKAHAGIDNPRRNVTEQNKAGQWCSNVLGILGFEWT